MMILSSRPQVAANVFNNQTIQKLHLQDLKIAEAVRYAGQLTSLRHANDPEMAEEAMKRIRSAATNPVTQRLMKTPLQITIIYLILERHPRPPQARHSLFQAYFDTIYDRETAKPGPLAKFLDDYKTV